MPIAAQIRANIEAALAQRIPGALTPRASFTRPVAPTGVDAIDERLGGGLPIGAITEIVGPECSGRTSLALAFMARMTRSGKVGAWVDVSDTLHPESAAAAGVDLDRLLWVRCGGETSNSSGNTPRNSEIHPPQTTRLQFGGNSPHPRNESKGLPSAIGDLLSVRPKYSRNKTIGTPGAVNRPLGGVSASREEQVASDRLPARRGAYVLEQREACEPRCAEPQHKQRPHKLFFEPAETGRELKSASRPIATQPWLRLDQGLRVTDLLLQAGGFSVIVLDMGSVSSEFVSRIPLATWFRYRAAAERTQANFVLLTQYSCAKSSAGAVLRLDAAQPEQVGTTVFSGFRNHAELSRQRSERESTNVVAFRKSPQRADPAEWRSGTAWAGRR